MQKRPKGVEARQRAGGAPLRPGPPCGPAVQRGPQRRPLQDRRQPALPQGAPPGSGVPPPGVAFRREGGNLPRAVCAGFDASFPVLGFQWWVGRVKKGWVPSDLAG